MSDSVGVITLDLIIKEQIGKQLDMISKNVKSSVEKPMANVSDSIEKSMDKSMKAVEKSVGDTSNSVKSILKQSSDEIDAMIKETLSKASSVGDATKIDHNADRVAPIGKSKLASEIIPNAPTENISAEIDKIKESFRAATDTTGLLEQKIGNIYSQIGAFESQIDKVFAEYEKEVKKSGAESTKAFNLDKQVTALQGKLISLQSTASQTEQKLNKAISSPMEQSKKVVEKTVTPIKANIKSIGNTAQEQQKKIISSATKTTSSVGAKFKKLGSNIKRAFKSVFIMAGLYAMFRAIKEGISSTARQNEEFSKSLNAVKGNLAVAFTPIIQSVMPMLNNLMTGLANATKQVAAFISGLFGKTYQQSLAATKQLKATQKEAQKAQKLMGMDEINTLDKSTSSGSQGADGGTDYSALDTGEDTSKAEAFAGKVKDIFARIGEALTPTKEAFSRLWGELERLGSFVWAGLQGFYDGFLQPVGSWVLGEGLPRFIDAIKDGLENINWESINKSLAWLWEALTPFAVTIGEGLLWLWENVLVPFGTWVMNDVVPAFIDLLSAAIETVTNVIKTLKPLGKWLWDKFLKPLAEWTGGLIVSILEDLTDSLTSISDWISNNQTEVETIAILVGSFAAAWGLVTLAIGIWNVVGAIATTVTAALGAAVAFLTSPIGLVILAIAALIAIIVLIVKHWDEIKVAAIIVWEAIKIAWGAMVDWFKDLFAAAWLAIKLAWKAVVDFFKGIWDGIVNVFSAIGDWFKGVFQSAWGGIKGIWDFVIAYYSALWEGIKLVFSVIGAWFKDVFQKAWDGIKAVFSGVGTFFSGIWDTIKEKFTSIGTSIGDTVGDAFKTVVNAILTFAEDKINGFLGAINTAIGVINKIPGVDISTLSMLEIPKLAKGGIASAPTLAMVGDNRNASVDPEVISPLSKLKGMMGDATDSRVYEMLVNIYDLLSKLELIAQFNIDGAMMEEAIVNITNDKIRRSNGRE